jgi:GNAT superfamily N-acetyltransferase
MKSNESLIPHNIEELYELLRSENVAKKSDWAPTARLNSNVIKSVWSDKTNCYVNMVASGPNYIKFMDRYMQTKIGLEYQHICMYYDEIIHVPENLKDKMYKTKMFTDNFIKFKFPEYEMMFVPYNKGVMLLSIIVDEQHRGKGIATDAINELYDLSEELNIPLYLQPYPDEYGMDTDKIWPKIHTLRKWYDSLGFGPAYKNYQWIWSNFTEEALEEMFVEDYVEKAKRAKKINKK